MDRIQRILFLITATERIFGHRAHKVLGRLIDILIPQRLAASHRQHVQDFEDIQEMNV
jgi:hypothetical protein